MRPVAAQLEPWAPRSCQCVEVHDRDHASPIRRMPSELLCAEPTERAAVGGEEDDGVLGAVSAGCIGGGAGVRPRQFDECGRSGGVVVGARPLPRVVAVSHDHDGLRRAAGSNGDDVAQHDLPPAGDGGRKNLYSRSEMVRRQLLRVPAGGAGGPLRARRAIWILRGQLVGEGERRGTVEGRGEGRSRQRARPGDGESCD